MHGRPRSPYDSKDIWKQYNVQGNPTVTVVMPVYNVAPYVERSSGLVVGMASDS